MNKKAKITCCAECPYLDNVYYDYLRECSLLDDLKIPDEFDIQTEVYDKCPLSNWED